MRKIAISMAVFWFFVFCVSIPTSSADKEVVLVQEQGVTVFLSEIKKIEGIRFKWREGNRWDLKLKFENEGPPVSLNLVNKLIRDDGRIFEINPLNLVFEVEGEAVFRVYFSGKKPNQQTGFLAIEIEVTRKSSLAPIAVETERFKIQCKIRLE